MDVAFRLAGLTSGATNRTVRAFRAMEGLIYEGDRCTGLYGNVARKGKKSSQKVSMNLLAPIDPVRRRYSLGCMMGVLISRCQRSKPILDRMHVSIQRQERESI